MKRHFVLPLAAIVGLAALSRSVVSLAAGEAPPPGTIVTVAGTGQAGYSGDGGPATRAAIYYPTGIALDAAGSLFFGADGEVNRVRRISATGIITTVAGSGQEEFSGDGGPATSAGMHPVSLAVDAAGDLYIADLGHNRRIRRVSSDGIITTVAGGGNPADGRGDGGPATSARLSLPGAVALDAKGNLFIADWGDQSVRMVTPAGTITTVAGTGQAGFTLDFPDSVAVDNAGHLYVGDATNHRVRMLGPNGTIRTVAGGGNPADGVGDGGLATDARLDTPTGLAVDGAGNLFIADSRGTRIRRVGPVGIISTVAGTGKAGFSGDDGPATQAKLSGPYGLAIDGAGNLYFSDTGLVGNGFETYGNQRIREVVGIGVPR